MNFRYRYKTIENKNPPFGGFLLFPTRKEKLLFAYCVRQTISYCVNKEAVHPIQAR